jgi:hypothetical protein
MTSNLSTFAPKATERRTQALHYLGRDETFTTLKIPDDAASSEEPLNYESVKVFETEIDNYYSSHIDYTPFFDRRFNLWRPSSWLYYIDIIDERTEQRFPSDADIRAVITAFRYSVEHNRRRIIALKRAIQAFSIFILLLPAILLAWAPAWLAAVPPMALGAGAVVVALLAGGYQYMRDSQLKSILESNGRILANKVQERASDLNRHFTQFLARIDREETTDNMADPEWTRRSAWWMKLSIWFPRRIEGIELFLQSEMQRTRIFMLRSAWVGYASAIALLLAIPAIAAAVVWLAPAAKSGGVPLPWLFWVLGVAAALAFTLYSVRTSIRLTDISEALGKEPLGRHSRFADLDLHNKIAAQIRGDKERYRQDKLRGGYAENRRTA